MEQPIGKREGTRKDEGKGWELNLCLRIDISRFGQPYAWVDFNSISELALNPVRGRRIWALESGIGLEFDIYTFHTTKVLPFEEI
jgi:hypothetical protein